LNLQGMVKMTEYYCPWCGGYLYEELQKTGKYAYETAKRVGCGGPGARVLVEKVHCKSSLTNTEREAMKRKRKNQALELETVLRIIKLRIAEGLGYRSIARKVGVDWKTVRKYVKLYEKL